MIPGERINLRATERRDAPRIHQWFNDPAVMQGWGWSAVARSLESVAAEVEAWLALESTLGRPAALVAETLAGDAIGFVLLQIDRPEARSIELSLLVGASSEWGKGLGGDILQTTIDACFTAWGVHRVGVRVEEENARALALYRRAGFQEEGRLRQAAFHDGRHGDVLLLSLLATEWAADDEAST